MPIRREDYAPNWELISRFIRFYRARNMCEWCSAVNRLPHPVTGSKVVLTVAHLDRNPKNNSFFNLAALCQLCHLNYDRSQHVRNRRYGRYHKRQQLAIGFPESQSIYRGRVLEMRWDGRKGKHIIT